MPGTAEAVKRALIGRPRAGRDVQQQLLPRWLAVPVFSSDSLSSLAYATQEMTLVLALAGAGAVALLTPLSAVVALLVVVVVLVSIQTVRAYPQGGGAYVVARENLGARGGLLAAAALLVDVALTAAVSTAVAAAALVSAFPELGPHLPVALVLLVAVVVANLRGVPEGGALFAAPAVLFAVALLVLVGVGGVRCGLGVGGCPAADGAAPGAAPASALAGLVVLRALATGAVALTGIQRITSGVPVFRYPQVGGAAGALAAAGTLLAGLLVALGALAQATGAVATAGAERTVLAQLGAALLGEGLPLVLLQLATAAVLLVAAHLAIGDFPRLASVLARDGWLPRQLTARGDRMAFSGGIGVLAVAAAAALAATQARVGALVPLYVVAVLAGLTCSQIGMARYWRRRREPGWWHGSALAAVGGLGTGLLGVVALIAGLAAGTWAVAGAVAALMGGMAAVRRHYREVGARLRRGVAEVREPRTHDAVIVVDRIDEPAARALSWVLGTYPRSVTGIGVPIAGADLLNRWDRLSGGLPLQVVADADDAHATDKLVAAVAARRRADTPTTVVLAEELAHGWVDQLRRHRLDLRLKAELRRLEGVAVADVTSPSGGPGPYTVEEPAEHHVLVLVSSVHTGVRTALGYARLLQPTSLRALSISVDPHASARLLSDWADWRLATPLEIVDSPFRSLADGVRKTVRRFAPDGRHTMVSCVLPELIGLPAWARPLHSRSAETVRSALLFERGVITIALPYRLPDGEGEPPA